MTDIHPDLTDRTSLLRRLTLIIAPLAFLIMVLLPAPEILGKTGWHVLAVALLMLALWITEAVPIPATSLLPMVLFPILGVLSPKEATQSYAHPLIFLFMGGFVMALAMQKWKLHRRIALRILRITGTHADGIIMGFMLATAFLSMWMSNTATTVMMIAIGISILELVLQDTQDRAEIVRERRFALSLMLAIAYAANIGGTATLIGTPPNALLAAFLSDTTGVQLQFFQWFLFGFPFAVCMLALCWVLLTKMVYPSGLGHMHHADRVIEGEWDKLGSMSRGEKMVLALFVCMAGLWMFKGFLPIDNLSDTVIAMGAAFLCFALPVSWREGVFILSWDDMKRLPWGILILFGGGLTLAAAMEASGLVQLLGDTLASYDMLGPLALMVLATTLVLFLTEMMGNTALISIMLPVLAGLAVGFDVSVLMLTIPAVLAASCAFMLPMATPPNAIVFASGHIHIPDMIRAGIWLNLISILVITLTVWFVAGWVFGF